MKPMAAVSQREPDETPSSKERAEEPPNAQNDAPRKQSIIITNPATSSFPLNNRKRLADLLADNTIIPHQNPSSSSEYISYNPEITSVKRQKLPYDPQLSTQPSPVQTHLNKLKQLKNDQDDLDSVNQNVLLASYLQNFQSQAPQIQPNVNDLQFSNTRSLNPSLNLKKNRDTPPQILSTTIPVTKISKDISSIEPNYFLHKKEGDIEDIVQDTRNIDRLGEDMSKTIIKLENPSSETIHTSPYTNKHRFSLDHNGNITTSIPSAIPSTQRNLNGEWFSNIALNLQSNSASLDTPPPNYSTIPSSSTILNQMLNNNIPNPVQTTVNPFGLPTNISGVDIFSAINTTLNNTKDNNTNQLANIPHQNLLLNPETHNYHQQQSQQQITLPHQTPPAGKVFICKHPGCGKTFSRKLNYDSHFNSAHKHQKPFKCGTCHKLFARHSDRRRHERSQHTKVTEYSCGGKINENEDLSWGCGKVFKRKDGLLAHWKSVKAIKKCFQNLSPQQVKDIYENIDKQALDSSDKTE